MIKPDKHYDYDYGPGMNGKLKPGEEKHDKLVNLVNSCVNRSNSSAERRKFIVNAKESDKLVGCFVTSETADDLAARHADPNRPVNVVTGTASAIKETFLSYMYFSMLGGREYYPITGRGGREAMIKTAILERVNQCQAQWFGHDLAHVNHWGNMYQYGVGALAPVWTQTERVHAVDTVLTDLDAMMLNESGERHKDGSAYVAGDTIRRSEPTVIEEGTKLYSVDPYRLIMDPDTPFSRYQEGRFCGWGQGMDVYNLITREGNPEEFLFNGLYVKDNIKKGNGFTGNRDKPGRDQRHGGGVSASSTNPYATDELDSTHTEVEHLYITLIPSEYGLSDSKKPEKWMLSVADEEILVRCRRLELDHCQYPLIVGAPGTDGFDVWAQSNMIKSLDMYKALNWNMNMWMSMDRKSITGRTIVDPKFFYADDWKEGAIPGQIARTKQPLAMGDSIDRHFMYVASPPASPHFVNNTAQLTDIIYTQAGTNQLMLSGNMAGGPDRPTATGMNIASQASMQRPQFVAQIISSQVWPMLTTQLSYMTIQFMNYDLTYSILGSRYEDMLREEFGDLAQAKLDKWELEPSFNVVPTSRLRKDAGIQQMLDIVNRAMSIPEMAAQMLGGYNLTGMMDDIARATGFENVSEWHKQGNAMQGAVIPDQQLQQQVQSGQLVPFQQAVGGMPNG